MSIETLTLPPLIIIGIVVEAHWNELGKAIPAAWKRLFASGLSPTAGGELDGYVEVSISRANGVYRELVGVVASAATPLQKGVVRLDIPANSYLSGVHEGALEGIAQRFGALYEHSVANELGATDFKLDFGYQPGLPPGRHQLYVGLAPFAPPVSRWIPDGSPR